MKRTVYWSTVFTILVLFLLAAPAAAQGDPIAPGDTYVVQPGDSLTVIAARHGLTATQLAKANGLRWDAWVYSGQKLRIPGLTSSSGLTQTSGSTQTPGSGAGAAAGGTYVVKRGDSLSKIARRYGVTVAQLAAANNLKRNAWIYAGQKLRLPTSQSGVTSQSGATSQPTATPTAPAAPAVTTGGTYIVRPGDTLLRIAMRHGLTVRRLAMANGVHVTSWVYIGQQLKIPGPNAASGTPDSGDAAPRPATATTYVVRPGDSLIGIAVRHGISVQRLAAANGIQATAWVYVGHRIKIPPPSSGPADAQPQPQPTSQPTPTPRPMPTPQAGAAGAAGEKWIDVNLSQQTVTAYAGQEAVFHAVVSTGTARTPTVVGTYRIFSKYVSTPMSGQGYYLPNVPHAMFFYRGYSFHGTYWHNNFGTPMSHGCVNMTKADAKWLFDWAPIGTKVVSHY